MVALATVCTSALLVSGCQTTGFGSLASGGDSNDVCYAYYQPLTETENAVSNSTLQGAVIGGVVGGILGYVIGGNAKSAAIGAGAGAAIGGVAGHQSGTTRQNEQKAKLISELNSRAAPQTAAMGRASGTIGNLTDCRRRQIDAIKTEYNAGTISKATAKQRLDAVRTQVAADNRLIGKIVGDAETRVQEYVKAGTDAGLEKSALVGNETYLNAVPPSANVSPSSGDFYVSTGSRVRSGPGQSYAILGALHQGDTISSTGTSADGQWMRFTFEGKEAYIHKSLVESRSAVTTASAVPSSASMPEPENEVQGMVQNTEKTKAAQKGHEELSQDIDKLFSALDA